MSVNPGRVEDFAELFHHYYSALAPDFGCSAEDQPEWRELRPDERRHFVAATRLALMEAESLPSHAGAQRCDSSRAEGSEGRECGC